ncbi:MAG: ATP-binding cassette domain-containing protein [Candidatus Kapabacteria bacterium]|nr:ATP-binding cassette domain-containing protein [Candidatus Kapabacteria bacterium]
MIEIKNLKKAFGSKIVLDGVDMVIPHGETMCIIGKSGCGKSVLLKQIVGLLTPDEGSIAVDGQDILSLNKNEMFELRQQIGFVFQGAALFDSYNVFENAVIGMYEHGVKDINLLEEEAKRVLSAVGLLPDISEKNTSNFEKEWNILSNKKPSDLSGGMKKRVGVARALVGNPKYIFYDEPTTGLDPVTSEQIDDLVLDLANRFKVTSIVITHDIFSVYKVANNVILLNNGLVQFTGTADDLKKSSDPVVQEFILRYNK